MAQFKETLYIRNGANRPVPVPFWFAGWEGAPTDCGMFIEAVSKNGFWFKVKVAADIKPEVHSRYFENLI